MYKCTHKTINDNTVLNWLSERLNKLLYITGLCTMITGLCTRPWSTFSSPSQKLFSCFSNKTQEQMKQKQDEFDTRLEEFATWTVTCSTSSSDGCQKLKKHRITRDLAVSLDCTWREMFKFIFFADNRGGLLQCMNSLKKYFRLLKGLSVRKLSQTTCYFVYLQLYNDTQFTDEKDCCRDLWFAELCLLYRRS